MKSVWLPIAIAVALLLGTVGAVTINFLPTDPLDYRPLDSLSKSSRSPIAKTSEAAVCIAINRPLFKGLSDLLTGGQVSELQSFLRTQGYLSEPITGFYGTSTEDAVKKFQKRYTIALFGGPSTTGFGATGPITRAKIKSISCYVPPPPRPPPPTEIATTPPPDEPPTETVSTVGTLSVTCRPSPGTIQVGQSANWRATIVSAPDNSPRTYSWQGTDNLTGNSYTTRKEYATVGTKNAAVTVNGQLFNCSQSLTVTIEPPELPEEDDNSGVWPPSDVSERPLYGNTDSPNDQNYNYTTHRYRILLSNDLNTNVQYALNKMSNMPEGRRIYTSITSDAQHRAIAGDPLDRCKIVDEQGNESFTSYDCPWWEEGVRKTKASFEAFADAFRSAGGAMDFVVLDTERHMSNWTIQSVGHADAIENDPRFAATRFELVSSYGLVPSDFHIRNSIMSGSNPAWGPYATPQPDAADNYLKWNEWNNDLTADYIEEAIYRPLRSALGSGLKGTDYTYSNHDSSYDELDIHGHRISAHGNGSVVGTHQSRSLYGALGNIPLAKNAFNALKFDQNQMRGMRLASSAPLSPWFAIRSWNGDSAYNVQIANTDYYEENILHAAMVSKEGDEFILWSNISAAGDRAFDNALTEFNEVAGYRRTPLTNDLIDWDADEIHTGTRIGDYKVWRFTPRLVNNQNIRDFITSDGNPDGSEPVIFEVDGDTTTFPNAFIYWPDDPVSDLGAWVIQQGSAGNPR